VKNQHEFLAALTALLVASDIPFMVSGSVASSFHGRPRATNDLDIVVDPTAEALNRLLKSLPTDWYVSADASRQALRARSMFNIIDDESGWKADLIVRKDRPFSHEEFRRRKPADLLGVMVPVVTPEDSILSKLEWARDAASERQFIDALHVALLRGADLDRAYLWNWAAALDVAEGLTRLLNEVDRASPAPGSNP
jgi:hypothetical protein